MVSKKQTESKPQKLVRGKVSPLIKKVDVKEDDLSLVGAFFGQAVEMPTPGEIRLYLKDTHGRKIEYREARSIQRELKKVTGKDTKKKKSFGIVPSNEGPEREPQGRARHTGSYGLK